MQTRLVENWLTSVKELSYTVPFAQLLTLQGYKVIHLSRGGAVEEGKDIIAIDKKGEIHCYQLKYGNINTSQWRDIKSELDELVEIPPKHPSLPNKVEKWHSYLVTNGTLGNSAARVIHDWAEVVKDRGKTEFQTILLHDLVMDFAASYGSFFPDTPQDLQTFLALYNDYGDDTLDNNKFKTFFENYFLTVEKTTRSKARRLEAINASIILCSYVLTNKSAEANHLEVIKAWLLLLFTVLHFAEKFCIPDKSFKITEQLIIEAIEIEFRQLIDEVADNDTHMVDGKYDPLSEAFVTYRLRCTELTGYISAYMNYHATRGTEPYSRVELFDKLSEISSHKVIFGESSVPLFINFTIYMNGINALPRRDHEASVLLESILSTHGRDKPGLPSPYYSLIESAEMALGIADESSSESFEGRSYVLWPTTMMCVRFGLRDVVAANWRRATFVSCQELQAENSNSYLLWNTADGVLLDTFPTPTQSWAKLVEKAAQDYADRLPVRLQSRKWLLPFLINVMPQRTNKVTVLGIIE